MSIYAYTGLPRSGKSYSVVEHQILPALKAGRRVVTNLALRWDIVREAFPGCDLVELPIQKVAGDPPSLYEFVTPGSLLVLDEVWRLFPAGEKANHVPEPFRKLLAEHGHMVNAKGDACQIVLVTQDLAQIGRFARLLVEQTFRTTKLTSVGMSQQFRVDVYNGPAEGPTPPENRRIRQIFGQYKPEVYRFYKTHTMAETEAGAGKANESAVDKRANVLRRPAIIMGVCLAPLLIGWGGWRLVQVVKTAGAAPVADSAEPIKATEPAPRSIARSAGDAVARAAGGSPAIPLPAATSSWRIAAVVRVEADESRSRVIVTNGAKLVTLPFRPGCYSVPDGRTFCDYEGQEISDYGVVGKGPSVAPKPVG